MNDHEQLTPELRAAEYVLGTLPADDCARVEAELPTDAALAREVAYWEQRLAPLGLLNTPVEPPATVWQAVQARTQARNEARNEAYNQARTQIRNHNATNQASPNQTSQPHSTGRSSAAGVWVGLAIAASMALFAIATVFFVGMRSEPVAAPPVYASLIQNEANTLAWLVTADSALVQSIRIVAMGAKTYDENWPERSLELWLLAADGQPVSLGLLPKEGVSELPVSEAIAKKFGTKQARQEPLKLAVSEEPIGGSPSGAPTGKVLFVAALNQRSSN